MALSCVTSQDFLFKMIVQKLMRQVLCHHFATVERKASTPLLVHGGHLDTVQHLIHRILPFGGLLGSLGPLEAWCLQLGLFTSG
jgi:hypothetical protein